MISYFASLAVLVACVASRSTQVSYIGCFVDNEARDLRGLTGVSRIGQFSIGSLMLSSLNMTHELCSSVCSLGGFPYFSVQANYHCFCGSSYGSLGTVNETDCNGVCGGNGAQMCGASWRNSVFALTYPGKYFEQTPRTNQTVESTQSTYWTSAAKIKAECLMMCEASADCQAVIFSGQQRLCHLLRFAYPPASLSSTDGDFFVRG
uniref:WSC domain-containing protein n=1 Tax=Macrostomum lignano TaxID=282301 RepID=A0A1I8GC48_9PLAT